MPFKYPSLEDRIIANSVPSEEFAWNGSRCWDWIGAVKVNRSGMKYGRIARRIKRGPRKGKVKTDAAHRVALKAFTGRYLGAKMVVKHLCNNSLCVNPAHLQGGTQRANVRQCVREGRHKPGGANQHGAFGK